MGGGDAGTGRQRSDEIGEAAQVVVLQRLRNRGHGIVVAPALAKEKELRDCVKGVLTGKRGCPRNIAAAVGAMACSAHFSEALGVVATSRRRRRWSSGGITRFLLSYRFIARNQRHRRRGECQEAMASHLPP